jgi:adenosylcobinamide kinase/adenosylcobinamide-phosphate guanylyltransferase
LGIAIEAGAVITLVLGGVRSGKSEVAERLAGPGAVTYLATGLLAAGDDDFAQRVALHRARRPSSWATVEEARAVPSILIRLHGTVLLDALGTWIANDLGADIDGLVEALVRRPGDTIVVSEEVGLGVHPMTEIGRLFADRLGEANRRIAAVADRCLLVVAGRTIELPAGELPAGELPPGELRPELPRAELQPGEPSPGVRPTGQHRPDPAPGRQADASSAQPVTAAPRSRPSIQPERDRLHPTAGLAPAPPEGGGQTGPGSRTAAAGGFRQAVAFLTPVGGAARPTGSALVWFPVVGALLGLVLGVIWWATDDAFGPFAAAALVVAADHALTGALHFDGLLDSADGLLPHLSPERRLEVMGDPHAGSFAVATGVATLLLRTAALTALGAARPLLLVALWTVARTAMAVTALTGRYARTQGLASSFLARPAADDRRSHEDGLPPWAPPAAAGLVLAIGSAAGDDVRSVVAVMAAGAAAAAVAALAQRRIGGFTGDTLGAGGVVAETIGLLTAVAVLRP